MKDEDKTKEQLIEELATLRLQHAMEKKEQDAAHTRFDEQILLANERLHYLLSSTSAVIYTAKPYGDYGATFITENVRQLTGYKPDEFLETSSFWLDHVHPDDVERIVADLPSIFEGDFHLYEYRFLCKDGRYIWVRDEMKPVRNGMGEPLEIIGCWIDVTVRKRMEEALRVSEHQFRSLIETIPVGIFTYEGYKFRYLNAACETITGYTREELLLKDFWELIHPEFQETAREYAHKRQRGEPVPERYELKFITKSGEIRWAERGAITIEYKERPLVLVTIIDITERKNAEEALRRSEEKYWAILENASDAILLADEQGNLIEANKMAEQLLGYTREELVQMQYTQLHPASELDRTDAAFKHIVTNGQGGLKNGAILRKDGTVIPMDICATAIVYNGTKVLQASFRDITEYKLTEEALERLVRERTVELFGKNTQLIEEIKERSRVEAALQKKKKELMLNANKLEKMNTALKVLLKQREEDKGDLEEKVLSNVKHLLSPHLDKLKKRNFDPKSKMDLDILESNLHNIVSSFSHKLSSTHINLTPTEIRVANLVREGKTTKEIAKFLGSSPSAINLHRFHIRSKLGLIGKDTNLQSYLSSLL